MPTLAFTTFAIMKAPYGEPVVKGFEDLTPLVFAEAEKSPGFVARAKEIDDQSHLSNFERDWGVWGKFAVPRFYDGGYEIATDTRASTLSLWSDIDLVHTFVYRSLHRTALGKRQEWFRKPEWPSLYDVVGTRLRNADLARCGLAAGASARSRRHADRF